MNLAEAVKNKSSLELGTLAEHLKSPTPMFNEVTNALTSYISDKESGLLTQEQHDHLKATSTKQDVFNASHLR